MSLRATHDHTIVDDDDSSSDLDHKYSDHDEKADSNNCSNTSSTTNIIDDTLTTNSSSKSKPTRSSNRLKRPRLNNKDDTTYDVEALLKKRKKPGINKYKYLVKWLDYDQSFNIWVDEDELIAGGCEGLVMSFNKHQGKQPQSKSKSSNIIKNNETDEDKFNRLLAITQSLTDIIAMNNNVTNNTKPVINPRNDDHQEHVVYTDPPKQPSSISIVQPSPYCAQFNALPDQLTFKHTDWIPSNTCAELQQLIYQPISKYEIRDKTSSFRSDEGYATFIDYIILQIKSSVCTNFSPHFKTILKDVKRIYNDVRRSERFQGNILEEEA